jgi:catalase
MAGTLRSSSTAGGENGSAGAERDPRFRYQIPFKFHTEEVHYDLVEK